MEQDLTLPEPISIHYKKISNIIDNIFSKKKEEVLTWAGSDVLCQLIYLYLFKKYGHNCLFSLSITGRNRPEGYVEHVEPMEKIPETTDIPLSKSSPRSRSSSRSRSRSSSKSRSRSKTNLESMQEQIPQIIEQMEQSNISNISPEFAPPNVSQSPPSSSSKIKYGGGAMQSGIEKYGDITDRGVYEIASDAFIRCYNTGMQLIICPLFLETTTGELFGRRHANILLFKRETNTFEVFEPIGHYYESQEHGTAWRDEAIHNFVSIINSKNGTSFKYNKVNITCPKLGLQLIEEALNATEPKEEQEGGGYCAVWSLFFTELVLANPYITQLELTRTLFDSEVYNEESVIKVGRRLRNMIRGYIYLIYEVLENYFSFLFEGKSANLIFKQDIIGNTSTSEAIIQIYINIEMELLKTGLTLNEWVLTIDVNDYPPIFKKIIKHMSEHDIFSDIIPGRTGGGKRNKNLYRKTRRHNRNKVRKTKRRY